MKRFSTFSVIFLLLLTFAAVSFAAPYPAAPPGATVTDAAFGGPVFVVQVPAAQYAQVFVFEYKNTLSQTTDMEQDGVAFSVLAEFKWESWEVGESCEILLIGRPIGEGISAGWGGGELFSSGFSV